MADPKIIIRRSSTPNKVPTENQLALGELAINTYDGKLYLEKDQTSAGLGVTVIAVNPWSVGVGSTSYNTYFTSGNVGVGLTNPTSKLSVLGDVLVTGVVTASSFIGDGSGLTGIVAVGSGIAIQDQGILVGSASTTLNFVGTGVSAFNVGNITEIVIDLQGNLDGGSPSSNYGGIENVNGGGI